MPPRDEATAKELKMIGKLFRDEGKLWRVDDVYYDEKAICPLTGYQRGALVVLHHNVGEHGIECPDDDDVVLPVMPLDEFMGEFDKDAEWVKAPKA